MRGVRLVVGRLGFPRQRRFDSYTPLSIEARMVRLGFSSLRDLSIGVLIMKNLLIVLLILDILLLHYENGLQKKLVKLYEEKIEILQSINEGRENKPLSPDVQHSTDCLLNELILLGDVRESGESAKINTTKYQPKHIECNKPIESNNGLQNIGQGDNRVAARKAKASWYGFESCTNDKCLQANTIPLVEGDDGMACSSEFSLGDRVLIRFNGSEHVFTCTDRGAFEVMGRSFDLHKWNFELFAPLERGLIDVEYIKL